MSSQPSTMDSTEFTQSLYRMERNVERVNDLILKNNDCYLTKVAFLVTKITASLRKGEVDSAALDLLENSSQLDIPESVKVMLENVAILARWVQQNTTPSVTDKNIENSVVLPGIDSPVSMSQEELGGGAVIDSTTVANGEEVGGGRRKRKMRKPLKLMDGASSVDEDDPFEMKVKKEIKEEDENKVNVNTQNRSPIVIKPHKKRAKSEVHISKTPKISKDHVKSESFKQSTITTGKLYACTRCGEQCESNLGYAHHSRSCALRSPEERRARAEAHEKHGLSCTVTKTCPHCGEMQSTYRGVDNHVFKKHPAERLHKLYGCSDCSRRFLTIVGAEKHWSESKSCPSGVLQLRGVKVFDIAQDAVVNNEAKEDGDGDVNGNDVVFDDIDDEDSHGVPLLQPNITVPIKDEPQFVH